MEQASGEPAVETTPVDGTSIPILPARDIPETLALFERLGFAVRHDEANYYAMVRRGAIELHFTASPDLDPWTSAGMAFVRLDDVSAPYAEFVASGAVPLVPGPRSELQPAERQRDELRPMWENGESIARMGCAGRQAVGDSGVRPPRPEQQPHPLRPGHRVTGAQAREPRAERPHMPDYGVDTPSWSPLPWSWAAERLAANRNFWVVTVSSDGRPHALPVWGVWDDGDARFAFSCGPRSRKARELASNPHAAVMVDDTVECLSLEGRASTVTDEATQDTWIDRYLAKYGPLTPDLSAAFLRANRLIEFVPERAFAVIEREDEFATRATKWVFEAGSL